MQIFCGWLMFIFLLVCIIWGLRYDANLKKTENYKKKIADGVKPRKLLVSHKWYFWVVILPFLLISFAMAIGLDAGDDNSADDNAKQSQSVNKKKHKKSKAEKEKSAEQSSAKKQMQNNLKQNLKTLKSKLAQIPDTTSGAITEAGIDDGNRSVTFVLTDEALEESDAQLKNLVREVWNKGRDIIRAEGPYPDNTIDRDTPLIYVKDSSGNTLGETNAWTSDFKYNGN